MKELAHELARQRFPTHLIFVGDPRLAAQETPRQNLTLHRWSQWLSLHYPNGVYEGEEAKLRDWNEQLPGFVASQLVAPAAAAGRLTAVLAEEWHTAYATCQLSDLLWREGLRDKTIILWNANNVMGFDRIDWRRLDFCAQITTVSRYMKHIMWDRSVNPLVIPNGIPGDRIRSADPTAVERLRAAFGERELVFKIGRFSPDKRWNMAMDALAEEKRRGKRVATVIRGGLEPHGGEVLANARAQGLTVVDVRPAKDPLVALETFASAPPADVYNVTSFMSDELISLFYTAADAVLANSGHEPFGLVGLEVMAAGGVVFVGSTGEDYAVPFLNSVVLDTDDPSEICIALDYLRAHPEIVRRIRSEAQETARSFSWENVVTGALLNKLEYVCLRQMVSPPGLWASTGHPAAGPAPGPTDRPSASDAIEALPAADSIDAQPPADMIDGPPLAYANPRTDPDAGPVNETPGLPYGGRSVSRRMPVRPRTNGRDPGDLRRGKGQE
jgi:glycosyltransferase involved in cell wall biosynthesis